MGAVRKTIRVGAELLLTIGLVGLLLCVHQLYWTNFEAEAKADDALSRLDKEWSHLPPEEPTVAAPIVTPIVTPEPNTDAPPYEDTSGPGDLGLDGHKDGTRVKGAGTIRGREFAAIYIPRLGSGFRKPIVEGSSRDSLASGVGHYTYPPYVGPGQVGNFGLAGHRNGHGEPFRYLNKLRVGDKVVVETGTQWFTYTILKGPYITKPSNGEVLGSQPPQLDVPPRSSLITLTTCDPEFKSTNRMIYWGTLTTTDAKQPGFKPAALGR
jgi:sortase A